MSKTLSALKLVGPMYEEKLRDEIIETQKSQNDYVKWKLVVVAVIGATGLGAVPHVPKNAVALLAFIPLVCIYVDAVCFGGEIRIVKIARFIRSNKSNDLTDDRLYETHFALLSFALFGASMVLSLLVFSISLSHSMRKLLALPAEDVIRIALGVTGAFGVVASVLLYSYCRNLTCWLEDAPSNDVKPTFMRFFFSSCVKKPNPEPPTNNSVS